MFLAFGILTGSHLQQSGSGSEDALTRFCRYGFQLIEAVLRLLQLLLDALEPLGEQLHTIHNHIGALHNLLLVLHLTHLLPGHLQNTQHGVKVLAARNDNASVVCILPKGSIVRECQLKGGFREDVHQHEIQLGVPLGNILRVILARQFVHMIAHTGQMTLQGILPLRLRLGIMVILEGSKGHLGVYNHIALVGEMQNGIGDKAMPLFLVHHVAVLVSDGFL